MWKVQFVIGLPLALETSLRARERDSISLSLTPFCFFAGFRPFALSHGKYVWCVRGEGYQIPDKGGGIYTFKKLI